MAKPKTEKRRPVGRQYIDIPEKTWEQVFFQIASTSSGIRKICAALSLNFSTIWGRILADEELMERYISAKRSQALLLSEEILGIADDGTNDTYMVGGGDDETEGIERVNYDVINRSKLRVNTRQWLMERLQSKHYGLKQKVEHSGNVRYLSYPTKKPIGAEVGE